MPFSCFLFRPRKTCEKRRKRSHINASNASVTRTSRVSQTSPQTPPPYFYQWVSHGKKWSWRNRLQMAHVHFRSRKRVHTRLSEKDRTQRPTRRNRGLPNGAAITTLGAFHTFWKPCVARCQNGKLCRFLALVGCVPEEHRKPAGQRCAYACRCPEASRPRWAA